MSTATDELVEIDVDLDAAPPCEDQECPRPATWRGRVRHQDGGVCNAANVCDLHKPVVQHNHQAHFAFILLMQGRVPCTLHQAIVQSGIEWERL